MPNFCQNPILGSRATLAWLFLSILMAVGSLSAHPGAPQSFREFPSGFTIFENGETGVTIELPVDAPVALREAVEEFQDCVAQMGGVLIPVANSSTSGQSVIRFAETEFPDSLLFPPGADDRFRIRSGRNSLVIEASDPVGWEFGLYTLLDEFGGVRWFWPGELGTHVPERKRWKVPHGLFEYEPAFVSRRLSRVEKDWARRNRLKEQYYYNHNLRTIFDRDFFLEHPEVLTVDWHPEDPPDARDLLWRSQPDLSEEVVVEAAAAAAIEAFRESPTRASFSLSPNDNTRFGDSPGIREWTRPMKYFRDLPDYSDLVFQFMNRVATIVSGEFPDRFLATHAYMWWENVPDFPVHSMVLPYLTADRSQGYDVAFTEGDRELVKKWTAAGPRLVGVYDYVHGAPHPFPRRANILIGQRIRDVHAVGARAYFSEINPIWPLHGDLPWMMARMLWDPSLKPGELEEEFFSDFFGPAAGSMNSFYTRAREVWMRQRGTAVWVKYYKNEAGVEIYSEEDLQVMTSALDAALKQTEEGLYYDRVLKVCEAWELTLAAANLQQSRRDLVLTADETTDLGPIYGFLAARQRWETVARRLSAEELTRNSGGTRFPVSDPSYHAARSLLENAGPEEGRKLAEGLRIEAIRLRDSGGQLIFNLAETRTFEADPEILVSGSICEEMGPMERVGPEPWELAVEEPWELLVSPSERVEVDYVDREEETLLRIRNAYAVGVSYHFSVSSGDESVAYEAEVSLVAEVSQGNRTQIQFQWWDEKDRVIGVTRGIRIPSSEDAVSGSFRTFGIPPKNAVRGSVMISAVRQEIGDSLEIRSLRLERFKAGSIR